MEISERRMQKLCEKYRIAGIVGFGYNWARRKVWKKRLMQESDEMTEDMKCKTVY